MKPSISRAWKGAFLLSLCASTLWLSGCGGGGGGNNSGGGGGSLSNPTARLTGEYNVNSGEEIGTFALAFVNNGQIQMRIASPNVLGLLTLNGTVDSSGRFAGSGSTDISSDAPPASNASSTSRLLKSAPRILKPTPGKLALKRSTKAGAFRRLVSQSFGVAVAYTFSGQLSRGSSSVANGTFTFGTGESAVTGVFQGTQIPSNSAFIGSFGGAFFADDSDETGELRLSVASDGITNLRATAPGTTAQGEGPGVFDFSSRRLTNTVRFQVGSETAFASFSGQLVSNNGVSGSGDFFAEGGDTGGWTITP